MGELKENETMLKKMEAAKEKDKPAKEKTFLEKFNYIRHHITIEPLMLCYVLPSVMANLANQNLYLEKACRVNLQFGDEVCDALTQRMTANFTKEETQVQQLVASMAIWKTAIQSSIPVLLMLFLGAWSDRFGIRKPLLIMPMVGELVTSIALILNKYYFYELPMEVGGLCEACFPAITGGWFIMFMGSFAYISDISTLEDRTIRIGAVSVLIAISLSIGVGLSGILYKWLGFYGVFSLAALLYMIGIIYGMIRVQEKGKEPLDKNGEKLNKLKSVFDVKQLKETLRIVFKSGARNRKMRVIMIMIVVMVIIGPMHGEMVVSYLFTRYKYNWDELDYSLFSTFKMVSLLLGTIFALTFFTKYLKLDDSLLGVISSTSKVLSAFVYALAPSTFIFYAGTIVEVFSETAFTAMRAIVSKLVPSDELGKVMSIFGVCEALMPLIYGPMYSLVYKYTMDKMPGLFYLLGGALTCPAIFIFFWLYTEHKKDLKEDEKLKANGKELQPLNKESV